MLPIQINEKITQVLKTAQVKTAGCWNVWAFLEIKPKTIQLSYKYKVFWSRQEDIQGRTWIKDYLNRREPTSPKEAFRFSVHSAGCKSSCSAELTGEMPTSHLCSSAFRSKDNNHSIWSWGTRLLPDFQAQASTIQVSISPLILERIFKDMHTSTWLCSVYLSFSANCSGGLGD